MEQNILGNIGENDKVTTVTFMFYSFRKRLNEALCTLPPIYFLQRW